MSSSSIKYNKQPEIKANPADNNNQLGEQEQVAGKSRKANQSSNSCRKTRQLRMFKVIIVIMSTFLVCRLPTWIFLLIKLNRDLSSSASWIVHFSFGLLSLANCAINPFLYTFLTETIRFGSDAKGKMSQFCCWWRVGGEEGSGVTAVGVEANCTKPINLHKPSLWKSCCAWWDPCGKEELPDDRNLIDHCESDDKQFRRKSYTLNGKLSCISSNVHPPFGHYANVYLNCDLPPIGLTSDPNVFVEVDLMNKK